MSYSLASKTGDVVVNCIASGAGCIAGFEPGKQLIIDKDQSGKSLVLVDGTEYSLNMTALDRSGLSSPVKIDSVTIDTKTLPAPCKNGLKDNGESDVDCGGICGACKTNQSCTDDKSCGAGLSCIINASVKTANCYWDAFCKLF